jgi:hypothetical protein
VPGTVIRIANNANDSASFKGKISNVQAQYGMPYSGGVGNADYLTISCEGSLAEFGRKSGVGYVMASAVVSAQLGNASTQSGYTAFLDSGVGDALMGSTTVSGTWADFLNYVALSNNFRMNDVYENLGSLDLQTVLISPFLQRDALPVALSDTTNNATNQVYDQIEFASYADNFYTQVSVDPESFAPQTVTNGAAPYRTYTVNTINGSASQALDYANYLLNNYKTPKVAISSISCLANAQNSMQLDALGMVGLLRTGRQIGRILNVTFRGTTYPCIIEGYTFSASPGEARYTYYVSAADLNAYLILDNATFGRLDFNKLGY